MCASLLFQILCIHFILNEVSSECDRMNGPSGLTACVHSPHYLKSQAAVCLPKRMITSTSKHLTCQGENTQFCWFLCTTIPSHGGLSACQCDPNSKITETSVTLDEECYLPDAAESCSWFSDCLRKRINCASITNAEEKCKELETISGKLSPNGLVWANMVKSCIQRNLVYLLYTQVLIECKDLETIINWSIKTCFYEEIHSTHQYCSLSFNDRWYIAGLSSISCYFLTYIPNWEKLLVLYVETNIEEKDKDTLATEIGEALSSLFHWKEYGLFHESVAPKNINKGKSITIRIRFYSKTNDPSKENDAIDLLKQYVEKGYMVHLKLKHRTIDVTHVISCLDFVCSSNYFSYQTRTIACTQKGGYCRDSSHESLPCAITVDGLCYQRKCCFTKNTWDRPCTEKGGWCQEESLSCDHYETGTCGGTKKCCLPITGCDNVKMIKRKKWNAVEPTKTTNLKTSPVNLFFIHHTACQTTCETFEKCAERVRGIQHGHMNDIDKKWDDIGYNFLAGNDGNIYEGRGWKLWGTHTKNFNHKSLAVSFIGNFMQKLPSNAALFAVKNLIKCGVDEKHIKADYILLGHRDKDDTLCPGDMLYNEIRKWKQYAWDRPCTEKGGWCQEESLSCDHYETVTCIGTKKCCLPIKGCDNVKMIKRKAWNAITPKKTTKLTISPVNLFFIHHTACSTTCETFEKCAKRVHSIQQGHMNDIDTKWDDIGYSFLAGNDGNIYEGRGWNLEGTHTVGFNDISLAVSFIGNFMEQLPSNAALFAVKNLIKCGVDKKYINADYTLLGHRDKDDTLCPGDMLYNEIRKWKQYGNKRKDH